MLILSLAKRESLDAVVVVPCHREGKGIIPLLYSLAQQKDLPPEVQIGVVIVVNNTRKASAEVLSSNQETLDLVKSLQTFAYEHEQLPENARKIYDLIRKKLTLVLIDLSSEPFAIENCNVGVARDEGIRNVALRFLKGPQKFLVSTDADTLFDDAYFKHLFRHEDNVEVHAVTGPVSVHNLPNDSREYLEGAGLYNLERRIFHLYDQISDATQIKVKRPVTNQYIMPGCNMAFRASTYRAVDGIPRVSGGEDTLFSQAILEKGMNTVFDRGLTVSTHGRFSDRTDLDASFGGRIGKIIELGSYFWRNIQTLSSHCNTRALILLIASLNEQKVDESYWLRAVQEQAGCTLYEARELYKLNNTLPQHVYAGSNQSLEDQIDKMKSLEPSKKYIDRALDDVITYLLGVAQQVHPAMQSQLGEALKLMEQCLEIQKNKRQALFAVVQADSTHDELERFTHNDFYHSGLSYDAKSYSYWRLNDNVEMVEVFFEIFKELQAAGFFLQFLEGHEKSQADAVLRVVEILKKFMKVVTDGKIMALILKFQEQQKPLYNDDLPVKVDPGHIFEVNMLDQMYQENFQAAFIDIEDYRAAIPDLRAISELFGMPLLEVNMGYFEFGKFVMQHLENMGEVFPARSF